LVRQSVSITIGSRASCKRMLPLPLITMIGHRLTRRDTDRKASRQAKANWPAN
jgi:hypothetical protein